MSTSSYAVQPPATNSDEQRRLRRDNRLELKDLSKLFRFGLRVSAPRYPMMYLFVSLAGGGLGSFCIFSFVTQSLVVGSIMGAFMALGGFIEISYPDFSQGVFLEMLLSNAERTREIAKSAQASIICQLVIFDLVFIPLATWFCIVPLSLSDLFGPNTYRNTIILWSLPCVSLIFSLPFEISRGLVGEIGRVWKTKIDDYLESVRETLLEENHRPPKKDDLRGLEAGAAISHSTTTNDEDDHDGSTSTTTITEQLSSKHARVEQWAREVTRSTSTANNSTVVFSVFMLLACIVAIASGGENTTVASVVVLSLFALMVLMWLMAALRQIAAPNVAWTEACVRLLNDPRVKEAISRLEWSDRWEEWLRMHELNANRAFGMKVTMSRMQSVSSAVGSIFAVVMYVLLRQELQRFAFAGGGESTTTLPPSQNVTRM